MLSGENFRRLEFHGTTDPNNPGFSLSGEVEGLQVSPELYDSLPAPISDKLAALRALRAEGQMNFSLAYDSKAQTPLRFQVDRPIDRRPHR